MPEKKSKGLGRGLDVLFATDTRTQDEPPRTLPLDSMVPGPYQPRTRMHEAALHALAHSIRAQGIMQPILVRKPAAGAAYEIIAGERRWRAARLAGLAHVPVLVRDVPDEAAAAMALIENIQREDLNPLEEAQGLARLVREFGLTHEQAAQAVGRSRSAISNLLRLLNLAEPVQALLMDGDIDMGHARALLTLERVQQIRLGQQIAAQKLSVREAEKLSRKMAADVPQPARASTKPRDIARVEEELADLLMAEVQVRIKKTVHRGGKPQHSGEIAIQFGSLDVLNGLIERLRSNV